MRGRIVNKSSLAARFILSCKNQADRISSHSEENVPIAWDKEASSTALVPTPGELLANPLLEHDQFGIFDKGTITGELLGCRIPRKEFYTQKERSRQASV